MKSNRAWFAACLSLILMSGCGSSEPTTTDVPAPSGSPDSASGIAGYEVVQVTNPGTISGTITVSGRIPQLPKREINKDPNVCGTGTRDSEQLSVSSQGGGLKNAVIIVEGVRRGKAPASGSQTAQMDQKNCEYTPHVQIVPMNTEFTILNSDPVLHNYHFYKDDETLFNVAQPALGQSNKHTLDQTGFIYAECDVHGWMQAHIAVVDNPYYAVTDESGNFSITDLPAGTYTVRIWHEYLGEQSQQITVNENGQAALILDLKPLLDRKSAPANITTAPAGTAPSAPTRTAAAAPTAAGGATEVTVEMHSEGGSFRFEPPQVTVKAGSTVKWVNVSDNRHTATDDPMLEKSAGQAILPAGAEPWTSPFLPNGQSFSRTFTAPGKYQYFCRNHEQFGMVGIVTVVP